MKTKLNLIHQKVSLLPGPVNIHPMVTRAFKRSTISHRSDQFYEDVEKLREDLCRYVSCRYMEFFTGSGTLANDVVGAHLSSLGTKGLILTNGEFGDRLIHQAQRHKLDFEVYRKEWGQTFDLSEIQQHIEGMTNLDWIWFPHCETSSGMINDLPGILDLCHPHNIKVCADCMSSIGNVPTDLSKIYLASGTSGKGFGSYPGIAMVYFNQKIKPNPNLPIYLDLGYTIEKNGVPFTMPTNLLYALQTSFNRIGNNAHFKEMKELSGYLEQNIKELGFELKGNRENRNPAVFTIELPPEMNSVEIGRLLESKGFYLSYKSEYLIPKNWIQICIMGEHSREKIRRLFNILNKLKSAIAA